jgi:hypothetical protein
MSNKKKVQLGMNPSTASGRLVKDILFSLVCETGKNICFHCGKEMFRDSFSIEHKIPWLDSENALELFFDLKNISFSHLSCNIENRRIPNKIYQTEEDKKLAKSKNFKNWWNKLSKEQQQKRRSDNYQKNGC